MRRLLALLALLPAPAWAQSDDYCPERPGLDTPPCIVPRGRVSVESSLVDWTRDDRSDARTDTVLIGDTLVRVGLTDRVEARIGWTPFGQVRERDRLGGAVDHARGAGDVTLGLKAGLLQADREGLSVALLPFATLPVGREPIGAGTWEGGMLLPVDYKLPGGWELEFTGELDAAADEDGHGRHAAYSATVGVEHDLSRSLSLTVEAQLGRDDDPADHATLALGAVSVGYRVRTGWQLDAGLVAGLNHEAPNLRLITGTAILF